MVCLFRFDPRNGHNLRADINPNKRTGIHLQLHHIQSSFKRPIQPFNHFYSNLLDIFIIIERTEKYLPSRYRYFKKFEFNKICFGSFVFSLVLNSPTFINWYTAVDRVELGRNTTFEIFYWGATEFSASIYGKVITFTVYFIRDLLFLGIKIGFNIFSVSLIRKYLAAKRIKPESGIKAIKSYITKTDRYLTKMVIVATVLSIIENIFFAFANAYYLFEISVTSGYLILFSYVTMSLKHGSNFLIFYLFNNSFKLEFKKSCCLFKLIANNRSSKA